MGVFKEDHVENGLFSQVGGLNYAMCVVSKLYGVDQWRTKRIHLSDQGFKIERPLLPYLFLFYVEGLSALLRKAIETQRLQGIKSCCNGVNASHLLFVDDSLLFCPQQTSPHIRWITS